jgi:ABC-type amino acid transport substrate-binding protein
VSYCHWGRAWAAFTDGRLAVARREGVTAADTTNYFGPISLPLAARAALWDGDAPEAAAIIVRLETFNNRGQAVSLDVIALRAGLAALEGRRVDAVAGYREALRGWQAPGLAFDESMTALDLTILLAPTEREMPEAPAVIEAARHTLERLGARPLLARLDDASNVAVSSM